MEREKWTVGHSHYRKDSGDGARVPFVICSIQYAYVELLNYEWCTQKRKRRDLLLSGHLTFVIRATDYHTIGTDCLTPAASFGNATTSSIGGTKMIDCCDDPGGLISSLDLGRVQEQYEVGVNNQRAWWEYMWSAANAAAASTSPPHHEIKSAGSSTKWGWFSLANLIAKCPGQIVVLADDSHCLVKVPHKQHSWPLLENAQLLCLSEPNDLIRRLHQLIASVQRF